MAKITTDNFTGEKGDTGEKGVEGWISNWSDGDTENVPYIPIDDRHSDNRGEHNSDDSKEEKEEGEEHGKGFNWEF